MEINFKKIFRVIDQDRKQRESMLAPDLRTNSKRLQTLNDDDCFISMTRAGKPFWQKYSKKGHSSYAEASQSCRRPAPQAIVCGECQRVGEQLYVNSQQFF